MPRVEFETPEQKEKFDKWILGTVWDDRFTRGAAMPLGPDGRGTLEIYYTKDDAIVIVDEASDYIVRKPVLVTSESFMEELKEAGVIFGKEETVTPDSSWEDETRTTEEDTGHLFGIPRRPY